MKESDIPKILILGEHRDSLLAFEKMLRDTSTEVVACENKDEVEEGIREKEFALMLVDVQTLESDCINEVLEIRSWEWMKNVPVIFMTWGGDFHSVVHNEQITGIVDYLMKPLDPKVLVSKVEFFLEFYLGQKRTMSAVSELGLERNLREKAEKMNQLQLDELQQLKIKMQISESELEDLAERLREEEGLRKTAEEERTNFEEQLRHAQKQETLGLLAGGIAHDFNNILGSILGYTEITMKSIPESEKNYKRLDQVIKGATRATEMIKQILIFSRHQEHTLRPTQIHSVVSEVAKLLHSTLPSTIELKEFVDVNSGAAMADPNQIHQIVMNLCTNSAHAIADGCGMIEVRLEDVELDTEFARVHPNLAVGPHLRLSVTDTGKGMDEATLGRIFEPFFTTKEEGEGTGLGLSVVHGIIREHQGDISVYSEPGNGTTFQIYLPKLTNEFIAEEKEDDVIPRGTERILIVDDNEPLAIMGQMMLEELGYNVSVMTESDKALAHFEENPQAFDLVITDQTMPKLTGAELTEGIRNVRPNFPVILTSGFSETVTQDNYKEFGICKYLMKPFVLRDIGIAVREALDLTEKTSKKIG